MQSLSEQLSFPSCLFQMLFTLRKKKSFWDFTCARKVGSEKDGFELVFVTLKAKSTIFTLHTTVQQMIWFLFVSGLGSQCWVCRQDRLFILNVNKPSILISFTHPHCFHWMQMFRASETFYQWKLQYPNLNALICKGLNISAHCVKSISINALNYHEKKYLYEKDIHEQI